MSRWKLWIVTAVLVAGCAATTDVQKDRDALMNRDKEWAGTTKDLDKFLSYYAADASVYPPGMPIQTGTEAIRTAFTQMASAPGFALQFSALKSDVGASGDLGYTSGTYEMSINGGVDKGKYVTVWKKQQDGSWKVSQDIFNSDKGPIPSSHVMVESSALKWGDPPPSLPPGAKVAVVSGDPTKEGPFVIRAQMPAGYKIAPHWHPGDENVTVLAGTVAFGMGDTFDESKMQPASVAGYVGLPGGMHHYFMAKSPATIQVNGNGPFIVNYINPADDPSKKK